MPRPKYRLSVGVYAISRASNSSGCAFVRLFPYTDRSMPLNRRPARAERLFTMGSPGSVVSYNALFGSWPCNSDFCAVECW